MTTLPAIAKETLAMYSELSKYLPYIDSYKVASEHATKVLEAHKAGQDVAKEAKQVRLASKKHRTALDKEREALKEDALRYGKAIDGAAKPIREAYEALEADMEAIEKYAEIMEAKRKFELEADRLRQLREVGHTFPEVFKGLGEMDEEQFEYMLHRERLAVIAQKAEAERKANEAKQAEEARARELAEAREKQAQAQKAQAEAEKLAREAQAKFDAERKAEAQRLAEAEALKAENRKNVTAWLAEKGLTAYWQYTGDVANLNREAFAKLVEEAKARKAAHEAQEIKRLAEQAEAKRLAEAEAKRLADAKAKQEEAEKLAKAGDKAKVQAWLNDVRQVVNDAPQVTDATCLQIITQIKSAVK